MSTPFQFPETFEELEQEVQARCTGCPYHESVRDPFNLSRWLTCSDLNPNPCNRK
jgi:hypothetical protein